MAQCKAQWHPPGEHKAVTYYCIRENCHGGRHEDVEGRTWREGPIAPPATPKAPKRGA